MAVSIRQTARLAGPMVDENREDFGPDWRLHQSVCDARSSTAPGLAAVFRAKESTIMNMNNVGEGEN